MRREHLRHLRCPRCSSSLALDRVDGEGDRVRRGELRCAGCEATYPIVDWIPRFVPMENYASNFGLEWTLHASTQYDGRSGRPLSAQRFFEETGWPAHLRGEVIIEAGSGSGRFTEHAASTGATVLSVDYSRAVEANHAANGSKPNVLIVQGDLRSMPFPKDHADRLFCFGVLQHTPDPRESFFSLIQYVRPGGAIVADVYPKTLTRYVLATKYWVRPLTCRLPPDRLYTFVRRYVDIMWPVARVVRRIPRIGPPLNWRLLIGDYSRELANDGVVDEALLKEWAYLDTFDMLSPRYDRPQTLEAVRSWCRAGELDEVDVHYGYNGIEIHAKRTAVAPLG